MLVLTRKQGERVVIGDGVEITVLQVNRNKVKLGFKAPAEVPIYREEINRQDVKHSRHIPIPITGSM